MYLEFDYGALLEQTAEQALAMMKPRPAMSISDWAEEHRVMTRAVTAKPGKFHSFPYQIEPQESFRDPSVIETVLWWAARLGKTEMLLNAMGYCMTHDPMSILVEYPTEDSAEKFSNKFVTPMIHGTPPVKESVFEEKSRDGGNTILNKSFTGGTLSLVGSNSPSKLRQVQAPLVICDEIDAMIDGPEGDPVDLAFKRADNYRYSINISSSTCTRKGSSRIAARYDSTDKRNWFVPCWKCNYEWVIQRSHIDWQSVGTVRDPVIICPECNHAHNDAARQQIVRAGKWVPTAPFEGYRGYWLNAYNTLLPAKKGFDNRLHQFVSEYLKAKKKGPGSLMVYMNTVDSELWEEKAEKIDEHSLSGLKEAYDHTAIPDGVLWLAAGVDTQVDRFEVDIWGFGIGEEAWHIQTKIIPGDPNRIETRDDLDEFLLGEWKTKSGHILGLGAAFVDSGGNRTKAIYTFAKGKAGRRVFAIKGASNKNPFDNTLEVVKQSRSKKFRCSLMIVHTAKIKKQFYDQLRASLGKLKERDGDDPIAGPRIVHFGRECDSDFFKSLVAEKLIRKVVSGKTSYEWRHDPSQGDYERNERLDCSVYAKAALLQFAPDFEKLNVKRQEAVRSEEPEEPKKRKRASTRTGRGRKGGGSWAANY